MTQSMIGAPKITLPKKRETQLRSPDNSRSHSTFSMSAEALAKLTEDNFASTSFCISASEASWRRNSTPWGRASAASAVSSSCPASKPFVTLSSGIEGMEPAEDLLKNFSSTSS